MEPEQRLNLTGNSIKSSSSSSESHQILIALYFPTSQLVFVLICFFRFANFWTCICFDLFLQICQRLNLYLFWLKFRFANFETCICFDFFLQICQLRNLYLFWLKFRFETGLTLCWVGGIHFSKRPNPLEFNFQNVGHIHMPGVKYKIVQNLLSYKSGVGWFFKKSRNTIHVLYFRKALETRTSKMMIQIVDYKIVQNLLSLGGGWGWVVFQKVAEHHTCAIFSESPGNKDIKNDDPSCQLQNCPKSTMSQLQILGLGGFSKSHGTPYMCYIFGKPRWQGHQNKLSRVSIAKFRKPRCQMQITNTK